MARIAMMLAAVLALPVFLFCSCAQGQRAPSPEHAQPVVTPPAGSSSTAPASVSVSIANADRILQGGTAEEIAALHYEALKQGDKDIWAKTLTKSNSDSLAVKGGAATFWWDTGRRYVQSYGVYYQYKTTESFSPPAADKTKLFFYRRQADGSERGMPVPIRLIIENGLWRVEQASY
ncbi:MAG: hypothetical protein RDV41_04620 [Planctomycetota bacterium]|nr:hypothetical protein [Planctomycetota bacterium]